MALRLPKLNPYRKKLAESPWLLAVHASLTAFLCYFCMYAFRRPLSVGGYGEVEFTAGIDGRDLEEKTLFLIAQVAGYCVSKFAGIRICSEVRRSRLSATLSGAIVFSWLALLIFAVAPPGWKVLAVFLNGLPLGIVWGLVVRHLEGRRLSEILLAALSCSYILASGEVKRVGSWLMERGVPELWMPFATGALFLPLFAVSVRLLGLIPPPDRKDMELRSARVAMSREERLAFVRRFLPGLLLLGTTYVFLTAYRDFRDNYQVDLFLEMGIVDAAAFSRTERPVAFLVMAVLALVFLVRNNRKGLALVYGLMAAGLAMLGFSTWAYLAGWIGGERWMILNGFGVYLAYVPFGSVLFERTIAVTRFAGTAVFAIYLLDASGYVGSVAVQLHRDLFAPEMGRLEFFTCFSWMLSIGGLPLLLGAMVYFMRVKPES